MHLSFHNIKAEILIKDHLILKLLMCVSLLPIGLDPLEGGGYVLFIWESPHALIQCLAHASCSVSVELSGLRFEVCS